MKRGIVVLLVLLFLLLGSEAFAEDYTDGRAQFFLGAGTGYVIGSFSSDAPQSELKKRWPTFLDMAFDYGITKSFGVGLRLGGTIEDSVVTFATPRVSWYVTAEPFLFSLRTGPTFCADPFLFGMEAGFSAAIMFNRYIGIELNVEPQFIFVGDAITGEGYLAPILVSFGIKGSV